MSESIKYYTLTLPAQAEIKIKGSKFIADIMPVANEEEANKFLISQRNKHIKAVHHCSAMKFGVPPAIVRSSDDGEPSGTAGKPILGQLDSFRLTNIVAVVTRYFGGILLGTGGLRKAYKEAVKLALGIAELIEVKKIHHITITCDILQFPQVMNAAKRFPGSIRTLSSGLTPYVTIDSEAENIDFEIALLKSHILGLPVDFAATIDDPSFQITIN